MKKLFVGALFMFGAALCSLDFVSAGNQGVSDQEAERVVGGDCGCYQNQNCSGGTTCTGSGLGGNGTCSGRYEYLYNTAVCGGDCTYAVSQNASGCGPGGS